MSLSFLDIFTGRSLIRCFRPSEFVLSDEGFKAQQRVYNELNAKLEGIQPGITSNI